MDLKFDRAKFDDVWRRVMPEAEEDRKERRAVTAPEKDDISRLRDFMDDEAHDALLYSALASLCRGRTRQTLFQIASDERCHLRNLKAAYFIGTGEMYHPTDACPLIYAAADTLRGKYRDEKAGAAAYRAAAEKTTVKELADTYLAHAEDESRHAKMIRCIIINMM